MQAVTVTIGRNTRPTEWTEEVDENLHVELLDGSDTWRLTEDSWVRFITEVRSAVKGAWTWDEGRVVVSSRGDGEYDGIPEDNYVVQVIGNVPLVATLRAQLKTLVRRYGQSSVALSVGETELVTSELRV